MFPKENIYHGMLSWVVSGRLVGLNGIRNGGAVSGFIKGLMFQCLFGVPSDTKSLTFVSFVLFQIVDDEMMDYEPEATMV